MAVDESALIVASMTERLFTAHAEAWAHLAPSDWARESWSAIEEMGLPLALLDEAAGGVGLAACDALGVIRLGAAQALPLPLAEAILANWILHRAGIALPPGSLTIASTIGTLSVSANRLTGRVCRVPYARHVDWIVVPAAAAHELKVALVPAASASIIPGENLAGEPRDDVEVDLSPNVDQMADAQLDSMQWRALGAIIRCQAIAGALERILTMTLQFSAERVQFGKPLSGFQVIQHNLAVAAAHVAAARGAADMAADAFDNLDIATIAVAKARSGEAAAHVASTAHQVHGALGFTREHGLHRYTQRVWSWREEYGAEAEWQICLGRMAAKAGVNGLWPLLTQMS